MGIEDVTEGGFEGARAELVNELPDLVEDKSIGVALGGDFFLGGKDAPTGEAMPVVEHILRDMADLASKSFRESFTDFGGAGGASGEGEESIHECDIGSTLNRTVMVLAAEQNPFSTDKILTMLC